MKLLPMMLCQLDPPVFADADGHDEQHPAEPAPFTPAWAPPALTNSETVAALQTPGSEQMVGSRRQSLVLADVESQTSQRDVSGQQPERGRSRLSSTASLQSSMARARSLDIECGVKRAASRELARPSDTSAAPFTSVASLDEGGPSDFGPMEAKPAFEALTLTHIHCSDYKRRLSLIGVHLLRIWRMIMVPGMEGGLSCVNATGISCVSWVLNFLVVQTMAVLMP